MKIKSLRIAALVGSMAVSATLVAQVNNPAPAAAPAAQAAPSVDPDKVVITIGQTKITAGEFNNFVSVLPPEVQAMAQESGKRAIADELVKVKLLVNEALANGLDKEPRFEQQMKVMRDNVLVGMYLQSIQSKLTTDEEVQKFYEAHKAEMERVTARHILISTRGDNALSDEAAKAKAEDIRKRLLEKPESFAEIAKAESMDPGSAEDGGDLQPFTRGVMVPEFEKAAFELKPGDISEPVKTQFGYHILQVKQRETPAYERVKEQIGDRLRQEQFQKLVETLSQKNQPKLDESFFGPPATQPAPAAAGR